MQTLIQTFIYLQTLINSHSRSLVLKSLLASTTEHLQGVICISGDAKFRILLGGYLKEIILVVVPPAKARIGAIAQYKFLFPLHLRNHNAKVGFFSRPPRRIVLEAPVLRAVVLVATHSLEDAPRRHSPSIDGNALRGIPHHPQLFPIASGPVRIVVLEVEALARPSGAPCHLGPRPVARRRPRVRGADLLAVPSLQLLGRGSTVPWTWSRIY